MSPPAAVLALALDALSPDLVERWARDETLPNLRALMDGGLGGRVHGIEGFFVGSTWPSLYTGLNPAKHGVHYELQLVPGTYDLDRVQHGEFVRAEPIWAALSRQGGRVAVLDVPLSAPADRINGVQVVDWGGHDAFFGLHTSPPDLRERLIDRYGLHPHGSTCDVRRSSLGDYSGFVDRLEAAIPMKLAWTRELLDEGGWDLFMLAFTEGHCVGHQCWHLHDPSHPAHDPAIARALGDPVRRIYRILDRAVGEMVEAVGEGTVLVWAGHGMSFWYGAHFLLPEILVRLGVSEPRPSTPGSDPGERGPSGLRRVAEAGWRRLPAALQAPVRGLRARLRRPEDRTSWKIPPIPADPERSLCFPLPNGTSCSGIRLNLVGREPAGRLREGAEADEFCAQIAADLLEIVDERTGGPLVERVSRTKDLYEGEHLDLLPDLLVEWCDAVPTGSTIVGGGVAARVRASSPGIGTLEGANHFGRTGEHRPEGWFVAAGSGIEPGRLEEGVSALDIAPTVAAMLGAELNDVDGRPVPELLGSARRPPRGGDPP